MWYTKQWKKPISMGKTNTIIFRIFDWTSLTHKTFDKKMTVFNMRFCAVYWHGKKFVQYQITKYPNISIIKQQYFKTAAINYGYMLSLSHSTFSIPNTDLDEVGQRFRYLVMRCGHCRLKSSCIISKYILKRC